MALQHLRSGVANKRPIPTIMSEGQIALNTNEASPGLFFKDSNGDLVKIGPVHVGTSAPNSSPASTAATALVTGATYQILTVGTSDFTLVGASANTVGTIFTATGTTTGTGTVSGQQGVEKGEQWLDTTGGAYDLKIYDGTSWRSQAGEFVNVTGDTMTGALLLDNAASASAPDLSFDGDANTGLYSPGADQVALATNGTGRLFVDASGNVGVGAAPDVPFHVKTGTGGGATPNVYTKALLESSDRSYLEFSSAATGLGAILFSDDSASRGSIFYDHNDDHIRFGTAGTERLRIDSSGRLGVGTSSPQTAAHIYHATDNGVLRCESGDEYVHIEFKDSTTTNIPYIGAQGDNLRAITGGAAAVTIDSSQRVGIGTTSPDRLLTVSNTSGDGTLARFLGPTNNLFIDNDRSGIIDIFSTGTGDSLAFGTQDTERMRIDSSGNVGIGTSSPQAGLEVAGTGATVDSHTKVHARLFDSSSFGQDVGGKLIFSGKFNSSGSTAGFGAIHGGKEDSTNGANRGYLRFFTRGNGGDPAERVRIDSSGRVGIGTTSPDVALDVVGEAIVGNGTYGVKLTYSASNTSGIVDTGNSSDKLEFRVQNSERMRIDSSGNVGIGGAPSVYAGQNYLTIHSPGTSTNIAGIDYKVSGTREASIISYPSNSESLRIAGITNRAVAFHTNDTERMRIHSSSLNIVTIGKTSASVNTGTGLTLVGGTAPYYGANKSVSGNQNGVLFYHNGSYVGGLDYTNTSTVLRTSSDYRLKENIVSIPNALSRAKQLNPVQFNFISNPSEITEGFLAHEVGEVVPLACFGEKDAVDENGNIKPQSLSQVSLIPLLSAALQEAIAKIENLEQRLSDAGIA